MLGPLGLWSHVLAAILYGALALWQLRHWNHDSSNRPLAAAFAATSIWCLGVAALGPQSVFAGLGECARNFGFLANYTYVSSRIDYLTSTTPGAPTIPATLIGLSKHTANGTLYYEDDRFSVRGSVAYRSGYLTSVPGRNNNAIEGTNSTFNIDGRISYEITDQLELSVEGINLTNQADDQYVDFTNRVNAYRVSGRQFYIGARFRF